MRQFYLERNNVLQHLDFSSSDYNILRVQISPRHHKKERKNITSFSILLC